MTRKLIRVPDAPYGFPYRRISDPTQRQGGGLARQENHDWEKFCADFGLRLSSRVYVDDGVSAWKGLNATPDHELGRFIRDAVAGIIPPGSVLIMENLDRLSRQNPWASISLVNDLRELQISVGRLDRWKLLRWDSDDVGDFFDAAIEMMRGHSESNAKSMRNGEAWAKKRREARQQNRKMTCRLPSWIARAGDDLVLIPERAEAIRRIYELATAGYGVGRIVSKMDAEGFPPPGQKEVKEGRKRSQFAGRWTHPYVTIILNDRRAMGEFQPCGKGRQPDGDPIPGYFPAVVTEAEWFAAKAARAGKAKGKRLTKHCNLFGGLLKNARDGMGYRYSDHGVRVLASASAAEGRGSIYTFPVAVFEDAMLEAIREVPPHVVAPSASGTSLTFSVRKELEGVEAEHEEASRWMDENGFSGAVAKRLQWLENRRAELASALAEAREAEYHPLTETLGEVQTLAGLLANAADPADCKVRIRACFQRLIKEAWLLVVPCGFDRVAAVQVHFAETGTVRSWLIYRRRAGKNRKGGWAMKSFADVLGPNSFDLRREEDWRDLEQRVLSWRPEVKTE